MKNGITQRIRYFRCKEQQTEFFDALFQYRDGHKIAGVTFGGKERKYRTGSHVSDIECLPQWEETNEETYKAERLTILASPAHSVVYLVGNVPFLRRIVLGRRARDRQANEY